MANYTKTTNFAAKDALMLDVVVRRARQILNHVRRHAEDGADIGLLVLPQLQELHIPVIDRDRSYFRALLQNANFACVANAAEIGHEPRLQVVAGFVR